MLIEPWQYMHSYKQSTSWKQMKTSQEIYQSHLHGIDIDTKGYIKPHSI